MKKVIYNLIIIISLCTFCFCGYKIYNYIKQEKEQDALNNEMFETAILVNTNEDAEDGNKLPLTVDFNSLKDKNKDIIAWIYAEDTKINYPIVKAKNNDYYLRKLIDGSYNVAGTLFIDYRNSGDFDDYNTIVFGHNMKNGTMFGTIPNYRKQAYYDEHKEMYLFTEDKNFKIELFAGFITSSESDVYKFPKTSSTNQKLINNAIKNSTFKSDVNVTEDDSIIALSTCIYDFENARYVLLGVLREIEV